MKAKRNIAAIKSPNTNKKYSIIIPAAGKGTRMSSYGPKSLIKIKNETIINRQLRIIHETFNNYEIILITGFQTDRVMNNTPDNIIKIENESFSDTNVLRSIGIGFRAVTTEYILVIYGDLVFTKDFLTVPFNRDSMVLTCNSMGDEEIGCISNDGYVENFFYELPEKWAQIVYLTGKELMLMKKIAWHREHFNMFGFEGLNFVIENGGKIKSFKAKGKVIDVDCSKDISYAEDIV